MSKEKKNIADHPFFVWMGFVGDVAALSVLWLVCCIPLVTIGASTTAAFCVAGKMAAKDDYLIIRDFLAALKREWKQATVLWGILAVAAVLIVTDYQIGLVNPGSIGGALIAVSAALGVCLISVAGASFSLLGRFSYPGVRAYWRMRCGYAWPIRPPCCSGWGWCSGCLSAITLFLRCFSICGCHGCFLAAGPVSLRLVSQFVPFSAN